MNNKLTAFIIAAIALSTPVGRAHELSARGYVGTGDNVLIGGIIIEDRDCDKDEQGNDKPTTFVIRVLGPSLTAAGVHDALQDPQLAFYDKLGRSLGGETNYTQVDTTTQLAIYARGLAPIDIREVVLVVKLLPGYYTAVVTGQNGTTGNALLEAYKLN